MDAKGLAAAEYRQAVAAAVRALNQIEGIILQSGSRPTPREEEILTWVRSGLGRKRKGPPEC